MGRNVSIIYYGGAYRRHVLQPCSQASHSYETPSLSGLQIAGHSNQCVKLKYLCTALKTTWMGADSALKGAV